MCFAINITNYETEVYKNQLDPAGYFNKPCVTFMQAWLERCDRVISLKLLPKLFFLRNILLLELIAQVPETNPKWMFN